MRGRRGRIAACLAVLAFGAAGAAIASAAQPPEASPTRHIVETLRQLHPVGKLIKVGNFPGGAALTPDGRFYWTVSAGYSENDIRIVDVAARAVTQIIQIPGASGGVALDGVNNLAYVSGEPDSDSSGTQSPSGTPGKAGDVIHVFHWASGTGQATRVGTIAVPPPSDAPYEDAFPPILPPERRSWPERLAVSPDGKTLLVALGLADAAAIIDTQTKAVRYVSTGSHPFGAAILPDGKTGLISNRGPGTVSVIDLAAGTKTTDIQVGAHLSHPEAIELSPSGNRAFVPLTQADGVAVVDLSAMRLERTLSTARPEGAGTAPVSASVTPDGRRLLVAESAADEAAVYKVPNAIGAPFPLVGRVPLADYPTDARAVSVSAGIECRPSAGLPNGTPCPKLLWTAAKGFGLGPNAGPPFTSQYFDIPIHLTTKAKVTGYVGIDDFPSDAKVQSLTSVANQQLVPLTRISAPVGTVLRPNGPIKHVFYIVKENRTYDQVLGDDPRGDGDPSYAIFGQHVTPNIHALVQRFPLLDRVYANSEASIDGHYWTAAAVTSDYVHRTWRQNYAGRQYPSDAWFFQIAYPQTGFLFDRASEQGVTWVNLGEGVAHLSPLPGDRDRNAAEELGVVDRYTHSDLGALTPGGCYDPFIGTDDVTDAAGVPIRLYDSSKPAGAPEPSLSRFDCFKLKFKAWSLTNQLPSLVYMTLPNNHTNGGSLGHHSPRAMVADNDLGLGQVIGLISHSRYWKQSAIFVVEDDSQDGMDHQDAHRIPALVASPYAKGGGAVIHTPYDMLSMIRSIELILGLRPLNLFDAQATPMYDVFDSFAGNGAAYSAVPASYPLLEENPAPNSAAAREASRHDLTIPDHISQRLLDRVIWKSVHGAKSEPPPPGPNAEAEGDDG
jgi:DNA-binding beta-propeller fold protein YncE